MTDKKKRIEYDKKIKQLTDQVNSETDLNKQWLVLNTIKKLNAIQRAAEWVTYKRLK